MTTIDPPVTATIFELFEHLLEQTSIRAQNGVQGIAFHSQGEVWSFVPCAEGRLFRPGRSPSAVLELTCRPEVLLQLLVTPGFELAAEEPFEVVGDISALEVLSRSMSRPVHSLLSIRTGDI